MKKFTTLLLAILLVLPAMADNMTGGEKMYLVPNADWSNDGARFAAYFFGDGGDTWEDATPYYCKGVPVYEVVAPNGNWSNVIFVRMDPNKDNSWDNTWGTQTEDLVYDVDNNVYTITKVGWNGAKSEGSWSNIIPTPTVSLAGAINGWNTSTTTLSANGKVYTTTIEEFSGEFKIVIDGAWFGQGNAEVYNGVSFEIGTGENMTWKGNTTKVKVVVDMTVPNKYPVLTITEWLPETITAGMYYLVPGEWEDENVALYAAKFINKNTDASEFVQGFLNNHYVYFQLDGEGKYTHMAFYRIANTGNTTTTEITDWDAIEVLDKTPELTYTAPGAGNIMRYNVDESAWEEVEIGTGVNRVELAGGIGYAYGVVSAEGAIEVYNVNGAVVARGNDNVDLRGLGRGVYIIRNGNQVRKVVR